MTYIQDDLGYEIHITFWHNYKEGIPFGLTGWSYSKIDGDPMLGPGINNYFTAHTKTYDEAVKKLFDACCFLDDLKGSVSIRRAKIEHIVSDFRFPEYEDDKDGFNKFKEYLLN